MGQQQLLLVILVTILVGIATVVAINVFGDAAEQGNRDAVRQDLLQASAAAQAVWSKPALLGGAGRDFSTTNIVNDDDILRNIGIPGIVSNGVLTNENGEYSIDSRDRLTLVIEADPATYRNTITLTVTREDPEGDPGDDGGVWLTEIDDGGDITISEPAPL